MHRTFLVDSYPSPAALNQYSATQATQKLLKKLAMCFSGPYVTNVLHTARISDKERHYFKCFHSDSEQSLFLQILKMLTQFLPTREIPKDEKQIWAILLDS